MANLYHNAHILMDEFIAHLYAARATTQERTGAIRSTADPPDAEWRKNKMAYFFSVLESRLELHEPPDDEGPASGGATSFVLARATTAPRQRSVK